MKTYMNPKKEEWAEIIKRPTIMQEELMESVSAIINDVEVNGDNALIKYAERFDGIHVKNIAVTSKEVIVACEEVSAELKQAIQLAYENITSFHGAQQITEEVVETSSGVKCWRKSVAIEKVGLYIPGGSAPLFSTVLMLGIPAKIAGCDELVLCSPPNKKGSIHPAILYTANLIGITKIYKVGGAQAIAAMAYGTESIPKAYKIFGPGNQYVTKAKELIQQSGVAIDMPAGPSEVLVIADETCNPAYVAADLLSQAEHGADSQVVLLSDNQTTIEKCLTEVQKQVAQLPRREVVLKSLLNSKAVVFDNIDECMDFSNRYAPEHLIIASEEADAFVKDVRNAGSVFLGNYSCEAAGDYASGTNHTLPTNGFAKNYSGVSVDSFVKKITFQQLSREGIKNIGPAIEIMAEAEDLMAHKNAVTLRLNDINDD